jgi:hypothetical protein
MLNKNEVYDTLMQREGEELMKKYGLTSFMLLSVVVIWLMINIFRTDSFEGRVLEVRQDKLIVDCSKAVKTYGKSVNAIAYS